MIDFLSSSHGICIFVIVVIIVAIQFYIFIPWFRAIIKIPFTFLVNLWNDFAKQQSLKEIDWEANESTLRQIKTFKSIFPKDWINSSVFTLNYQGKNVSGISSNHENSVFKVIIYSLNQYITNNEGAVSDFHLMKDIVDRNCDAKEEEINTQIPVPLYLGLVGTMAGILVGVGFLVFTGGLNSLLNGGAGNGSDGIEALLGGVALAMISSIVGIILTTWGSLSAKNAKARLESNKNTFLSFIQAQLLPNLPSDVSTALVQMSRNLQNFNSTFSGNTNDFRRILEGVNKATDDVAKTLVAINNLDVHKIANANIKVYEKLKNCTDEIGKLGEYLQSINQYQANTTQAIEDMHNFFSSGIEQIDSINIGVKNALERFSKNTQTYLESLQEKLDGQILNVNDASERQQLALQQHFAIVSEQMKTAVNDQSEIFKQKLKETTTLVEELKNLSAVENSISDLVKATNEQKCELSTLNMRIEKLAQMKAIGGEIKIVQQMPRNIKIAAVAGGCIVSLAGLSYLVPQIVKWLSELIKLL